MGHYHKVNCTLNIAEGAGKRQIPDRNRFYGIARGSAMECAAICDVLGLIEIGFAEKTKQGKLLLKSIVSILTTVCSKEGQG